MPKKKTEEKTADAAMTINEQLAEAEKRIQEMKKDNGRLTADGPTITDLEKKTDELKKELNELAVVASGVNLVFLRKFAEAYLDEYKQHKARLPYQDQDRLPFAIGKFGIQLQYGRKHGSSVAFFPTPQDLGFEYLVRDQLDLANPAIHVEGNGCLRMILPNAHQIYFKANTAEVITEARARQLAQQHFNEDLAKIHPPAAGGP